MINKYAILNRVRYEADCQRNERGRLAPKVTQRTTDGDVRRTGIAATNRDDRDGKTVCLKRTPDSFTDLGSFLGL